MTTQLKLPMFEDGLLQHDNLANKPQEIEHFVNEL